MGKTKRIELESALGRYYASQRDESAPEAIDPLVEAMVAEDAKARRRHAHSIGAIAFVAAQVRHIPAWTWAAHAALIALMFAVAAFSDSPEATKYAVGILSAMAVLVDVPVQQASAYHGVAELEYACPNNAASVTVARLIVLGCSSALAVTLMAAAAASALDIALFEVAVWAYAPFFLSCAGSLMTLRKAPPSSATMFCVVWSSVCSAALLALANLLPDLYAHTSLAVWLIAAAAALVWLAREVALTLRAASAGLDVFSPHMAKTNTR